MTRKAGKDMTRALAVALVFVASVSLCQESQWQVRRAQVADQTEEWTRMGRIPGWAVSGATGRSGVIEISGDEEGAFRGTVLIGRPWRVPSAPPADIRVSLEYQTYCAIGNATMQRSGALMLAVFTPQRWQTFALEAKDAQIEPSLSADEGALATAAIHANGRDVTDWAAWEGPDLAPRLRAYAGQEVVIAVVWTALHFCEEWAKLRNIQVHTMDREQVQMKFLEDLDLDAPGLEAVKDALDRQDVAAAKAGLIEHMRTRERPVGPPVSPDGSQRALQAADDVCDHVFGLVGCPPTKLEEQIRWNEDPHDYDQWAIALNRHSHWVTLGRAYAATGDEKYAREFVAQLTGWIDAMPVHIGRHWVQGPYFEPGKSPLTLDAGIRMAQTWWPAYYYFKDSPSFGVEAQFAMIGSFVQHARYLMNADYFHPTSNWGAMEANGLLHIAVMLPEFKQSVEWLRTAEERLAQCLKAQVYPDGAQIELTPGYHGVTLMNVLWAAQVTQRNDVELPGELVAGLEKMFDYYVAIAMPDGRMPALNDSGWGSARGVLVRGVELFPHRSDFEYVASGCREGIAPTPVSRRLPYAGWNIMRTGWGRQDKYLMFETGPFGAGHQHEDKLGIILHAAGRTILTEAGTYAYDTSDWRRYALSTRAHNTVMVDGAEQRRRTQRDTYVQWEPEDAAWMSDDTFDYARGVYASGYGNENELKVAHTRQVAFIKPDYWVVLDTLTPSDDEPHSYEALFHLDSEGVDIDAATQSVTVEYEGAGFRIIPFGAQCPRVQIVEAQTEPWVQGWVPTGQHNVMRPVPTAIYRWEATGPRTVGFLLIPRDPGGTWPVAEVDCLGGASSGGLGAQIVLRDGSRDIVARPTQSGTMTELGPLRTDAEFCLVRVNATGDVRAVRQIGGSQVAMAPQ